MRPGDAALKARLLARLDPLESFRPAGRPARSDFDLNPGWGPPADAVLAEAAVLVPIVERPEGFTVLLTRRADTLRSHAGQVAFPGGRLDPGETPWAAALREAEEEIGLDPALVTVAGLSSAYETVTRFHVTPIVGFVRPGFSVSPREAEVAAVFEAPLDLLLTDSAYQRRHFDMPDGRRRYYWALPHGDQTIWGATAGMLRALGERLSLDEAA